MPTVKGRAEVKRHFAELPGELRKRVLRGAARAGAAVVMDEAKERVTSADVRENLTMKAEGDETRIVVKITVKPGWARSVANWLEYGTDPHLISVDESQRRGMSVRRINERAKNEGGNHSLVIGGRFVGATVLHPGAQPHPFLRVSLDLKEREAVAAAQSYINARVRPSGIIGSAEPEGDGV